jgi:hypothetical protein
MTPSALRRAIRDAGRVPLQRDTRYGIVREFPAAQGEAEDDALDGVRNADERFGTYAALTRDSKFRFQLPRAPS